MNPKNKPLTCYVTDRKQLTGTQSLSECIERAVSSGADWVQIREKDLPAQELLRVTSNAIAVAAGRARILVNDRMDVAIAAGAHGVHLGNESLPIALVVDWIRRGASREFMIGASCHALVDVERAARDGASYVVFGPVFSTPSKVAFGPPLGVELLRQACRAASIPVLAIGGVTPENAGSCLDAGAAGVAAIRYFQSPRVQPFWALERT